MNTILFPGSFNPFTVGHQSLVARVLPLFDGTAQRVEAIRALYASEPKVSVIAYSGLTVDACEAEGARWMLRGVRSAVDFEYERNLADINRRISGIETLLLFTLPEYAAVSSSMVRELRSYGRDVSEFLPQPATEK